MAGYIGVNGKARKIKGVWVGVGGKARKVQNGYVGVAGKARQWYAALQVIALPTQFGSLIYTGAAQSPRWNRYDAAKMTPGGTTGGINAGTYNATFTPKEGYCWPDGTTEAKTVQWTIGKAAGSLNVNPSSFTLNNTSKTQKVSVLRAGNGSVWASSSNTRIASVSVSGTTVTVTGVGSGNAVVTIGVYAETNHTAPANKSVPVYSSVTAPAGSTALSVYVDSGWNSAVTVNNSDLIYDSASVPVTIGTSYDVMIDMSRNDQFDGAFCSGCTYDGDEYGGTLKITAANPSVTFSFVG